MASPDVAMELERANTNLLDGHCVCVFHVECVRFISKENTDRLNCRRCRAYGVEVRAVTDRNCLRCGVFAADALCRTCFELFCLSIESNIRSIDQAVEMSDFCRSFMSSNSLLFVDLSIAWMCLQLLQHSFALKFVLVEENGNFVARLRAWALVELWRKILSSQQSIRFHEWAANSASCVLFFGDNTARQTILSQALDFLPQKGLCIENGLIQKEKKRPVLTDDGYFALGKTLCASGLFDFYDQKRKTEKVVGRYFVASKNDFVYYIDRPVLHIDTDPSFAEKWQTLAVAICAKPREYET